MGYETVRTGSCGGEERQSGLDGMPAGSMGIVIVDTVPDSGMSLMVRGRTWVVIHRVRPRHFCVSRSRDTSEPGIRAECHLFHAYIFASASRSDHS